MRRPALRWPLVVLAAATGAAGLAATAYWLLAVGASARPWSRLPEAAVALPMAAGLSLVNVGVRWVRWHYLMRRLRIRLPARESLIVFTGTLPAILTPFYVGELVRAVLVGRRLPAHRLDVAVVWAIERCSDLLLLALFAAASLGEGLALALAAPLWLAVLGLVRRFYRVRRGRVFPRARSLAVFAALTVGAGVLPAAALLAGVSVLGGGISPAAALGAYAHSAVVGNVSGLPVGVSLTGSSLVLHLRAAGIDLGDAVLATLVFRAGTVWFVVAFGAIVALVFRRSLLRMWRSGPRVEHFEAISGDYAQELPEHVRARLLERKVRVMDRWLDALGTGAPLRGLDVGCGHGWYACEMQRRGYLMHGVEPSAGQIAAARRHALRTGGGVRLARASAAHLPFRDASFDFAYAINVLHHVDETERERVLAEIVRVLRPGGIFFLQEINTENPLFRFYMGYAYPLLRAIDEGTEHWISPRRLPAVPGAAWAESVDYFTFLPDFLPGAVQGRLAPLERTLERGPLRTGSAHYVARLVRRGAAATPP